MIRKTVSRAFGRSLDATESAPPRDIPEETELTRRVESAFRELHHLVRQELAAKSTRRAGRELEVTEIQIGPEGSEFRVGPVGAPHRVVNTLVGYFWIDFATGRAAQASRRLLYTFHPDPGGNRMLVARPADVSRAPFEFTSLEAVARALLERPH